MADEDPAHVPLAVGVGVSTGVCVVGNIGSRWRYDYSALGDAVNLASRLEGLTKEFGVGLLIGPETARRISDCYDVTEIARTAVRGRSEPAAVFTVVRERTNMRA
jgi:adenylate cyclase